MKKESTKVENSTSVGNSTKPLVVRSADEIPDFIDTEQWWCPSCQMIVEPECVTYEETHDERCGGCGNDVL